MTTCPACSRPVAEGKTDLIGQAACAEIRRLLNLHEVPVAAFIDDHVLNAITQRDEAHARIERLEKALLDAVKWISEECRPDAEWVAQGHNWSMSDEDRARGSAVLKGAHAALSKPDGSASK